MRHTRTEGGSILLSDDADQWRMTLCATPSGSECVERLRGKVGRSGIDCLNARLLVIGNDRDIGLGISVRRQDSNLVAGQ